MIKPIDKYLLHIPKALMDEMILDGGLTLYMDVEFNPEWKVCSSGIVKYKPEDVTNVEIGDEVAISYSVIAERKYPNTDLSYFPTTEGSAHFERYKNAMGWWLTKQAFPLPTGGVKWAAIVQDDRMELIDGTEGTQSAVERWMSQFSFGNREKYTFTNLVDIKGESLWKAERYHIFAKKVGNEIISISDRVICLPIEVDFTQKYNIAQGLALPPKSVMGMFTDRALVISGGENIGLKKNDIIGFEPKFCEKYTLWGVECFLIKDERVDLTYETPIIHNQSKIIYNEN